MKAGQTQTFARASNIFSLESRHRLPASRSGVIWSLLCALIYSSGALALSAGDMQLEALLVWGTNEEKSPEPKHKPVGPELKKQLQQLPLKWTNYFEIKRVNFAVPASGSNKVPLSEKCEIEVKNRGHEKVEVAVFGKGKQVATRNQDLLKNGTLILGGDSPGTNCWLAVIKRID
jgi:hypothetical protein